VTSSKLQSALLGGLFIGVLSALPVVSIGNLCCCLWLVTGGVLSAWLAQQRQVFPLSPMDGAAVGALAGIIGAFVYLLVAWPVTLAMGPMLDDWVERALEGAGDVPWRDVFERYRGAGTGVASVAIGFFLQLVLGLVFPTLGGLLGAVLFQKPLPPPPPPPLPTDGWTAPPPPSLPGSSPTDDGTGSHGVDR
jgi:hypothetical protein